MNREERERRVDATLERALGPQSIEPRLGFEERLLANLAAQPERRPWWRWMWVPALAAAAVIAILIGVQMTRRTAPVIVSNRTNAPPEQPAVIAKAPAPPSKIVRHKVAQHVQPRVEVARAANAQQDLPKQDVFPAPVPMTEQEHLLLALIRRRPQQVQKIAAEQEADRQQIQKYLESGFPSGEPGKAQQLP